jgi:hypothetical protein
MHGTQGVTALIYKLQDGDVGLRFNRDGFDFLKTHCLHAEPVNDVGSLPQNSKGGFCVS